jgi:anaerobic selenocysteine-containing dehydrogenase
MSSEPPSAVHHRVCNLCEAACGLEIRLQEGRIASIRGDAEDPFSRGHVCPKAVALQDLQDDPDRLRRPLRRRPGGGWEEVGWEEALDAVAVGIRQVQTRHGRDALAVYLGNPNAHHYGNLLYGGPLLRTLRTRHRFSATSVDQLPHHVAACLMLGHQLLLPIPDLDRTAFLLVLGANPAVSNGSLMTAPGARRRLKELRARGGRLVVVDPRRTETARLADRHLFIRPGADVYLLLALLHVILGEGLEAPGALAGRLEGLERLREVVAGVPPERVAAPTGIAPEEVRRLARDFAGAPSAVCYGRLGASTQAFGGLCQWLVIALDAVTGNLDRPGGAMFTTPAVDLLGRTGRGHLGRWRSRVRGLPEFGNELPVAVMAEEILTPGKGQIRGLLTVAGNPVLSAPHGSRLERAIEGLELMVAIDPYLNETTRHAHFVLPPTAPLERDHFDLVFNALAVRNTARYSSPLFDPPADARHDWQIFAGLQRRLGRSRQERWRSRVLARLGPRRLLDFGLRGGPYGTGLMPFRRGLTLQRLEAAPHGLDLGPLEPRLEAVLKTPGGRIDLAPTPFLEDLPRLLERLEEAGDVDGRLQLVGRRQVRSNNSWMHNVPRLMRGRDRCTLLMHPADAARHGVEEAERVKVASDTGSVEVPLEISDEMMPGVVSLPHGWGHHRPGTRQAVAAEHPGASLNDLTDDQRVDALTGVAAFSGVPVTVEPA